MKKTILIVSLIVITALLSYQVDWLNYLLIVITILSITFLIVAGIVSIFKKLRNRIFKVPIIIICTCILGIIAALFRPYDNAIIQSDNLSKNLEYAYKTDQDDRKELKSFIGYFSKLKQRDSIRLKQVRSIYNQNKIIEPIDKFHAAFVFHHSDNTRDYKIASKLAEDAASSEKLENNYTVQWLRKASYDRYMISIGKPEKYNTQNSFNVDLN